MGRKKGTPEVLILLSLLVLFNLFLLNIEWVRIFLLKMPGTIVAEYRIAQYFVTYSEEFVKRGL
jgi:hypothetical protein